MILGTLNIGAKEDTKCSSLTSHPTSFSALMRGVLISTIVINLEYGIVLILHDLKLITRDLMCSSTKFGILHLIF